MKFKSCILASILGLLNVIPSDVNAKFALNPNFPYFYKQSPIIEGVQLFRSIGDSENDPVIWYKLVRSKEEPKNGNGDIKPRECYSYLSSKSKFFKPGNKYENREIWDKLIRYDFYTFRLSEIKEKVGKDEFFDLIYQLYEKANSDYEGDNIYGDIWQDNPLTNFGVFFNGLRERCSKHLTRQIFDILKENRKKGESKYIDDMYLKNHNDEITKLSDLKIFALNAGKGPLFVKFRLSPKNEKMFNIFSKYVTLQHASTCKIYPSTLESKDTLMRMKVKHWGATGDDMKFMQDQNCVFFSLLTPGMSPLKKYQEHRPSFYYINDITKLPLISISKQFIGNGMFDKCFVGSGSDALRMFVDEFASIKNRDKIFDELQRYEVRAGGYVIPVDQIWEDENLVRYWTSQNAPAEDLRKHHNYSDKLKGLNEYLEN